MEIGIEKTFYEDGSVTVTQSRFTANGRTYAMRNISSVMLFHKTKTRIGEILLMIVGGLCLIGQAWIASLILITIGVLIYISRKDTFSVRISSNSGEADGLESENREYIRTIVEAVNEAIVFRG